MRIVLVESPYRYRTTESAYSSDRLEAIRYALWAVYDSITRGEAPFASHLFYTQMLPETETSRNLGLAMRDSFSRQAATLVARYTDLGISPGMVRDVDCTLPIEERTLGGLIRAAWLAGEWPQGSVRLALT